MINERTDAMAVIFPNHYDSMIPEISQLRMIGSLPFASRYRIIDFYLSGLVNGGIDNIAILTSKNYHSLLDHIGSGREWDLVRKNGGITIFPPYSTSSIGIYDGWIEGLYSIRNFLTAQKEEYAILSDAAIVTNFDYEKMLTAHIDSGADVTVAYTEDRMPDEVLQGADDANGRFYTVDTDGDRVVNMEINARDEGIKNLAMNIYIVNRKWLIDIVHRTALLGGVYLVRDIFIPMIKDINIRAFRYEGYTSRIIDMKSYFRENMRLLEGDNISKLFAGNPIYTKVRDDNPTRYRDGARASNVMVADGCVVEGDIENCVLFRGVKISKGAKVRNSILMQDTFVGEGVNIDYCITDKRVSISPGIQMSGCETLPIYITKGQIV